MSDLVKFDPSQLEALDANFDDSAVQGSASFTRIVAKSGKFRDAAEDSNDTWTELDGYIVGFRKATALWLSDSAEKPALSSYDGKTWDQWDADQLEDLGDADAHTVPVEDSKYTQWGSDPNGGKGKWAKDKVYLYLMTDDSAIPYELQVAAASIKYYTQYKTKLQKQGLSAIKVRTKFALEEVESGSNVYDVWQFDIANKLVDEPDPGAVFEKVLASSEATATQLEVFKQRAEKSQTEEAPF